MSGLLHDKKVGCKIKVRLYKLVLRPAWNCIIGYNLCSNGCGRNENVQVDDWSVKRRQNEE